MPSIVSMHTISLILLSYCSYTKYMLATILITDIMTKHWQTVHAQTYLLVQGNQLVVSMHMVTAMRKYKHEFHCTRNGAC